MIPGVLKNFADATAREAYTVPAQEVGGLFYQLSDSTFYRAIATGTGSTTVWEKMTGANQVCVFLGNISSKASDAAVARAMSPVAGRVSKCFAVLLGALATGDATFTFAIGTTGITSGVVTSTQSGSAAGDVASATPSALNTVVVGSAIKATCGGSSSATATANIYAVIDAY